MRQGAGKTSKLPVQGTFYAHSHCHPHSVAALGYLRAIAVGNETPGSPSFRCRPKVLHGRGAAVYTNVYGLAIQYTSVLIFRTTLVAALVVAYIARLIFFGAMDTPAQLSSGRSTRRHLQSGQGMANERRTER